MVEVQEASYVLPPLFHHQVSVTESSAGPSKLTQIFKKYIPILGEKNFCFFVCICCWVLWFFITLIYGLCRTIYHSLTSQLMVCLRFRVFLIICKNKNIFLLDFPLYSTVQWLKFTLPITFALSPILQSRQVNNTCEKSAPVCRNWAL